MNPAKRKRLKNVAIPTTGSTLLHIAVTVIIGLFGCGASLLIFRLLFLQAVDTANGFGVVLKTDSASLGLMLPYLVGGVVVGLATLGIVVYIGEINRKQFLKARKLDLNGVITQGTITDLRKKRGLEERVFYCVTYRYGDKYEATTVVKRSTFQQLSVGDTVAVRLLPDSPSISRPEWNWTHREEV
jgi:hypothetical protein